MSGDIVQWLLIILLFVGIFWYFNSRRRPTNMKTEITVYILQEIDYNIKVIEVRRKTPYSNKTFRMSMYIRYSTKLEYLPPELEKKINEMYATMSKYNDIIKIASKSKIAPELHNLDLDNLKKIVDQNRADLIEWLRLDYEAAKKR